MDRTKRLTGVEILVMRLRTICSRAIRTLQCTLRRDTEQGVGYPVNAATDQLALPSGDRQPNVALSVYHVKIIVSITRSCRVAGQRARPTEYRSGVSVLLLPTFAGCSGSGRCAHTALGTFGAKPSFRKRLLQIHAWKVELCTDTVSVRKP